MSQAPQQNQHQHQQRQPPDPLHLLLVRQQEQLVDLRVQLLQRDHALAQRDHELAALRQQLNSQSLGQDRDILQALQSFQAAQHSMSTQANETASRLVAELKARIAELEVANEQLSIQLAAQTAPVASGKRPRLDEAAVELSPSIVVKHGVHSIAGGTISSDSAYGSLIALPRRFIIRIGRMLDRPTLSILMTVSSVMYEALAPIFWASIDSRILTRFGYQYMTAVLQKYAKHVKSVNWTAHTRPSNSSNSSNTQESLTDLVIKLFPQLTPRAVQFTLWSEVLLNNKSEWQEFTKGIERNVNALQDTSGHRHTRVKVVIKPTCNHDNTSIWTLFNIMKPIASFCSIQYDGSDHQLFGSADPGDRCILGSIRTSNVQSMETTQTEYPSLRKIALTGNFPSQQDNALMWSDKAFPVLNTVLIDIASNNLGEDAVNRVSGAVGIAWPRSLLKFECRNLITLGAFSKLIHLNQQLMDLSVELDNPPAASDTRHKTIYLDEVSTLMPRLRRLRLGGHMAITIDVSDAYSSAALKQHRPPRMFHYVNELSLWGFKGISPMALASIFTAMPVLQDFTIRFFQDGLATNQVLKLVADFTSDDAPYCPIRYLSYYPRPPCVYPTTFVLNLIAHCPHLEIIFIEPTFKTAIGTIRELEMPFEVVESNI
ncbi:hypothetical protein GQ42DRAFT_165429, partial [Ramicandelaber brevisporus]